jgi:hypothetical protein
MQHIAWCTSGERLICICQNTTRVLTRAKGDQVVLKGQVWR